MVHLKPAICVRGKVKEIDLEIWEIYIFLSKHKTRSKTIKHARSNRVSHEMVS